MNLRKRHYPSKFWFTLHNYTVNPSLLLPPKKTRAPTKTKIDNHLSSLAPHIQKSVYNGAIDKRKGEIRTEKYPLSSQQFILLRNLGASNKYSCLSQLEHTFDLQYKFNHKGYVRSIKNIQFRLQQSKPVVVGKMKLIN